MKFQNLSWQYNPDGCYTASAREQTTHRYMTGKANKNEVPFHMLPIPAQQDIIDDLNVFFPTACIHCNTVDEAAFPAQIGVAHCQNCGEQCGYVPISTLPELEIIKQRIWDLCGHDLEAVKKLGIPNNNEGWKAWWDLYLKARNK